MKTPIKSLIASAIFASLIAPAAKAQSKFDFKDLTYSPDHASVDHVAQAQSEQNTSAGTAAESSGGDTEALAKAAQNPIASMVSIPIQWKQLRVLNGRQIH